METVRNIIPFSDWKSARDTLRKWREERKRKSADVLNLGSVLLADHGRKLGDESKFNFSNINLLAASMAY